MSINSLLFLKLSPMKKSSSSSLQNKETHSIVFNNVYIHHSFKFLNNNCVHKKLRQHILSTIMADHRRNPIICSDQKNGTTSDRRIKPLKLPESFSQRAISQTLESTANLASLLPSGTLLAFELLMPIFTNDGSCDTTTRPMTLVLLAILASTCFLASFTDSIEASDGQIYHGLATLKGLWIFDYPAASASGIPDDLSKYRVNIIDMVHAVSSVFVFVAIALKDNNVVQCFYPSPDHSTLEILDVVPIGIGLICSLLFVVFPSRRRGIGKPLKKE
ncbi:hypothetical protein LIER_26274 [Lithospermum erythrorhizon]|uniref:Uncharacterized protein n=1 Tax=Lithospermum erythrorhizon TaxID=34254 RepID=A0AAV3R930_LITER